MKGQATIIMLLLVVVALIMFVSMLPILNQAITDGLVTADSGTGLLLRLIPFAMAVSIVAIPLTFGKFGGG